MDINNKYFLTVLMAVLICFCSCADNETLSNNMISAADQELEVLLNSLGGKESFILPESHDYDNIPQDVRNPISAKRIALGKRLFFETGLAVNPEMSEGIQTYSCATCHVPGAAFQAGVRQGIGDGGLGIGLSGEGRMPNPNYEVSLLDIPPIRVPNNLNAAYITNATWDGKLGATAANVGTEHLWVNDLFLETNHLGYTGVETQAIAGLEFHRMMIDSLLVFSSYYKDLFDFAFEDFPIEERYSFETAGLAIAAFERSMLTNQAPFQYWLSGDYQAMTPQQKHGAVLFFDKAGCVNCHTGPALNGNTFHAIGMGDLKGENVLGDFSDIADNVNKGRGGFTADPSDDYKFKTPQLYALKNTRFLGHGATFTSLRSIIEYKNLAIAQNPNVSTSQLSPEFIPLNLSANEIDALVDFVENALLDDNLSRYVAPNVASGNCIPNNDYQSQIDMNCH